MPRAAAGDVEEVDDEAGLDDFLGVMAGAYGWSDDGRDRGLGRALPRAFGDPEAPLRHVVVRDGGGAAVACASLFPAGGHAFVTNVGTIPAARGRRPGTSATLAVLEIAAPPRLPQGEPDRLGWAAGSTPGSASARTPCSDASDLAPARSTSIRRQLLGVDNPPTVPHGDEAMTSVNPLLAAVAMPASPASVAG